MYVKLVINLRMARYRDVTNITERYMSMHIDVRLGGFVCTPH